MSSGTLFVRDSRTNKQYEIPIKRNAVSARYFKQIKAPGRGTNRADQVQTGLRVHDPGLINTTVVETAISFSDHERGLLLFRGYSLEELWESDFEDMLHLLVWGSYPMAPQRENLRRELAKNMLAVPESVQTAVRAMPSTTPPLALMIIGLSAYLATIPGSIPASTSANQYQGNPDNVDQAVLRTVAGYAVVFGAVASHRQKKSFTPPSSDKTYCENLFVMSGLVDPATGSPDPVKLSCFRRFAMLNADHGMALTVFSALVTASSLTDPISCLITSVTAAWGPLHFGATESAQRALREIGTVDKIPEFLDEVKQGRRKLFGYGHRSYNGVDPRVRPIQSILKDLPSTDLLKLAEAIEQAASKDDYFRSKGLYPNADFYGNFVFTGIGFELGMLPVAMLAQRIMGIMAHWREYMLTNGKLFRPSHLYTGDVREDTTTPLLPRSKPYSIFTPAQKRLIILTAAIASSFSPLSANIYYPALNALARDLHVTDAQINLTITTYMICQSLAPTFTASFADTRGRRPAYILCFLIYIMANILLALQHSYPALLILRAVQSTGSSGTVALASAVAADIITSDERGVYMGFTSLGNILAPSLGPILGGVLSEYAGWQSIFWFLAVAAGAVEETKTPSPTLSNPLSTLRILFHPPTGLILISNGLVFASYYAVTAGIPSLFKEIYGLSDLGIGFAFIPAGLGSLVSATFNGATVDWNYRRVRDAVRGRTTSGGARETGETTRETEEEEEDRIDRDVPVGGISFPIERARLQIGAPMTLLSSLTILGYALFLPTHPPLPLTLALVFLITFTITASYNVMNVLLVDLYYSTPASAMATNNLVRCLLGAASTALVQPCIKRWGVRGTFVHIALLFIFCLLSAAQRGPLPLDLPILHLRYPNTPWVFPGDTLLMSDTHPLPRISRLGLNSNSTYLLLFVDLDVLYEATSTVILHWYQPDMMARHSESFWLEPAERVEADGYNKHALVNATSGAEYIAPQPPPDTHHRYVYLLFEQHAGYEFPGCFGHIFPATVKARAGFDTRQFIEVAGLRPPVAGNYFFVNNNEAMTSTTQTHTSPTTTWLRSAPCTQPGTATRTPSGEAPEHDRSVPTRDGILSGGPLTRHVGPVIPGVD
ncbi:putative citrate synthase [Aspergillus lucknowensis]|uniref:Citrate synthase n=1 Tax=Aspergillus lucknowensis TaxID=176173 RepID=A0ABR4LU32_9EURO